MQLYDFLCTTQTMCSYSCFYTMTCTQQSREQTQLCFICMCTCIRTIIHSCGQMHMTLYATGNVQCTSICLSVTYQDWSEAPDVRFVTTLSLSLQIDTKVIYHTPIWWLSHSPTSTTTNGVPTPSSLHLWRISIILSCSIATYMQMGHEISNPRLFHNRKIKSFLYLPEKFEV